MYQWWVCKNIHVELSTQNQIFILLNSKALEFQTSSFFLPIHFVFVYTDFFPPTIIYTDSWIWLILDYNECAKHWGSL